MRANIPTYEMQTLKNLREVLQLLSKEPGVWRPFAGGTDLMVLFEAGKLEHKNYLNLWGLKELKGIQETKDFIEIGALTTYSEIVFHPVIQKEFPMLCRAASLTGAPATQNRGTLGGNIVNASPAADSPPALLAYEAELEIISLAGVRREAYSGFHTDYKKMKLGPAEILKSIRLPRKTGGAFHYYRKVGARKMQAISKVCFAGTLWRDGESIRNIRIGLGSVAPIPLRCFQTEAFLNGKKISEKIIQEAKETIAKEISPIDDIRSTKRYRERVTQNLLEEFLKNVGLDLQTGRT